MVSNSGGYHVDSNFDIVWISRGHLLNVIIHGQIKVNKKIFTFDAAL